MSKLGWFIGGTLTGIAGVLAAAHFLGDDVSSSSSYAEDELETSQDEAMAFENEDDSSNSGGIFGSNIDDVLESNPT